MCILIISCVIAVATTIFLIVFRNKKYMKFQDWKMSVFIMIGLLVYNIPGIIAVYNINDKKVEKVNIPVPEMFLSSEIILFAFFLTIYRVFRRVKLNERYESLKKKARLLMGDEKDYHSASIHSKNSSRDKVTPVKGDNESSDSKNNSESNHINVQPYRVQSTATFSTQQSVNTSNTVMPTSVRPGNFLGGVRPMADLVVVGDSDTYKFRRSEWLLYICYVLLCVISFFNV